MLRHIKKIEVCSAHHLKWALPLPEAQKALLREYIPFKPLCTADLVTADVEDVQENGVRTWTTKITAVLPARPAPWTNPVAFRLTAVDGTQYLVGLPESPYPVVTFKDTHPDKASGRCACVLTVTWHAAWPMLELVD